MAGKRTAPRNIDEYIAGFSPEVQAVLREVRRKVREAAPEAEETISYQIPAFWQDGILVYFAAFKQHVGFYPPVRGDASLERAVTPYAGEKGNLRFPLDQPMPLELIGRITKVRVKQNRAKAAMAAAAKARATKAATRKKARI